MSSPTPGDHINAAIAAWRSMGMNNLGMLNPSLVAASRVEAGPIVVVRKQHGWVGEVDFSKVAENGSGWLVTSAKWLASCLDYEECKRAKAMIVERFPHLAERANQASASIILLREIWNDGVSKDAQ